MSVVVVGACGSSDPVLPVDSTPMTVCNDGVDNDGDTLADYPADPGCHGEADYDEANAPIAMCRDERDNDGDGLIDFPDDPGCFNALQNTEVDDCPDGAGCPACSNTDDDDEDGNADYPEDTGCSSAADNEEYLTNVAACGEAPPVNPIGDGATGQLISGAPSQLEGSCGGVGDEVAYEIKLEVPTVIVATTDNPGTTANTVLYLRSDCPDARSEIVCNDDLGVTNGRSTITADLAPGVYVLVVDNHNSVSAGDFELTIEYFAGTGSPCTSAEECFGGLECRIPTGQTEMICIGPVCSDAIDDDADGTADYPGDPGCAAPDDADETDECPAGPTCPACANDVDDDGDGDTDYPDDINCAAASGGFEACPDVDGAIVITSLPFSGTTVGAANDFDFSCSSTSSNDGPDKVHSITLPATTTVTIAATLSFDSVVALLDASCTGAPLACFDFPNSVTQTNLAAGTYNFAIDGWSSGSGPYTIDISGTIAAGESCETPFFGPGRLVCAAGHDCTGTPGSRTCMPAACNDAIDADGDGFGGYPTDPGCVSISDGDETDDCPSGPGCPDCANDLDDDGDTLTDYPEDTSCAAASGLSESCIDSEGIIDVTAVPFNGTTVGQTDDTDWTCTSTTPGGPDRVHRIVLPATTTVTITSEPNSYDASIVLLNSSCTGTPLACNDFPEAVTQTNLAAGTYYFVTDAWSTGSGTYQVNISGQIVNGESCESPFAQSGALTCSSGYACQGAVGSRTCQPSPCNDTIDADGDGFPGFPTDPGCSSASDATETDDCPSGPTCPVCSNDLDDDGDSQTDYPMDTSCSAASSTSESCPDTDGVISITSLPFNGTTVGAADNFDYSACTSSTPGGPDRVHQITLPKMDTVTISGEPNSYDASVYLLDATCTGTPLVCNDFPEGASRTNLAAGTYYFVMDAWSTGSGTYTMSISGTISQGGSCEGPFATAGQITCAAGSICTGPVGNRKCGPPPCNDGADSDGDGLNDYPFDPGCTGPNDTTETDTCPSGAGCPACANDLDDDGDTLIDYPNDPNCVAASTNTEDGCSLETDPLLTITTPATTGTTTGFTNDFLPTCQSNSSVPDRGLRLTVPVALSSLHADTLGSAGPDGTYDTVLSFRDAACATPVIACDDDGAGGGFSAIDRTNVAPGSYLYVIDGWNTTNLGPFVLNVHGVAVPGAACTSPLFMTGVLSCATGETCTAGVCQP
jgi:hypothetical protein